MDPLLLLDAAGFAAASLCAAFGLRRAATVLPAEDRRHRDRPPRVLHALWPIVRLTAHLLGPRLPLPWRSHMLRRLQQAELDLAVSPQEWLAGIAVCAVLAASMLAAAASALATPMAGAAAAFGLALGGAWGPLWLRDEIERRRRAILRELPTYLDVITLGVEGGCGLTAAVAIAVDKAPPSPLRRALERFLREVRAGRPRIEALRALDGRLDMPAVSSLTAALIQAESSGSSLGTTLRAQAEQRAHERFARAERLAMEAPVKLLAPLILCIFPCTFIVLGFPVAVRLLEGL